jgi:hypothetical protein
VTVVAGRMGARAARGMARRLARTELWRAARSGAWVLRRALDRDRPRENPFVLTPVDPLTIRHMLQRRLPARGIGRRLPGDWDRRAVPVSETTLYRGLRERFVEGLAWEDTVLHPGRYRKRCPGEPDRYRRYSPERFAARGAFLDRLYRDMATNGYRSYREVGGVFEREMGVAVGRDGQLIRNTGGLHRLILSQLLELPRVPVRVVAVHEEWSECVGRQARR